MKCWVNDYKRFNLSNIHKYGVLRETGQVVKFVLDEELAKDYKDYSCKVCVYPKKEEKIVQILDIVPFDSSIKDLLKMYGYFRDAGYLYEAPNKEIKDNMASLLFFLIGKSDHEHFARFEKGFPEYTEFWKIWHNSPTMADFVNTFELLKKENR